MLVLQGRAGCEMTGKGSCALAGGDYPLVYERLKLEQVGGRCLSCRAQAGDGQLGRFMCSGWGLYTLAYERFRLERVGS